MKRILVNDSEMPSYAPSYYWNNYHHMSTIRINMQIDKSTNMIHVILSLLTHHTIYLTSKSNFLLLPLILYHLLLFVFALTILYHQQLFHCMPPFSLRDALPVLESCVSTSVINLKESYLFVR